MVVSTPFDKTVEIINELKETYPLALDDVGGYRMALLCELARIRKALEKQGGE